MRRRKKRKKKRRREEKKNNVCRIVQFCFPGYSLQRQNL